MTTTACVRFCSVFCAIMASMSALPKAAEARERLRDYKFDLLIVDIMMPEETGLEFLEKLRRESSVPVIMLTAMGETEDRITGLEAAPTIICPNRLNPKSWCCGLRIFSLPRAAGRRAGGRKAEFGAVLL